MAIQLAGGVNRNDVYPGITTYPDLLDAINDTLVAAGWTSTSLAAFNRIQYTGQPSNNNTIIMNGVTYTFRNAINNATPNEVHIGADADVTWQNFVNCVNAGPGGGTAYSSATAANATFSATYESAGNVKLTALVAGPDANGLVFQDGTVNAAFQYIGNVLPLAAFGGYLWTSAATPSGIKVRVYGWIRDFDSGNNPIQIRFILADESGVFINPAGYLTGSLATGPSDKGLGARLGTTATPPSSTWRVIADRYQFFAFADTIYTGGGIFVAAGVPWIPTFLYPKAVGGATNASPVVITTTTAHGYTTGDVVSVSGVNGNGGANGNYSITVLTSTTFSLDGSTGTGAYTSGGYVAKVNQEISNIGWMANAFTGATWLYSQTTPADYAAGLLNGSTTDAGGSYGTGTPSLVVANDVRAGETGNAQLWYSGDVLSCEPVLSMGVSNAGTSYLVGQFWDAFFHEKAELGGTTGTFDGKNWYVLTNNFSGDGSNKQGALVLLVP